MNAPESENADDVLTGSLKETVERIRAAAPPAESTARIIERGLALERAMPVRSTIWSWQRTLALAAGVGALAVLVGVAAYRGKPAAGPTPVDAAAKVAPPAGGVNKTPAIPQQEAPVKESVKESPRLASNRDGVSPAFGGVASGRTAGASPSRYLAIADDATVLVSTGGDKPIRLGERQPYDRNSILHVWDWSKSDLSRPLAVSAPSGIAVSPDGKWIVSRDGRVIEAATSAVTQLPNCDGQVSGMRFSPDGKTLLLLTYLGAGSPGFNDSAVARVLDFPSGNKRFEIEGQWIFTFACAFTPDNAQLCLMDKDRFIRRWDARTGKELTQYQPAFMNSIRSIVVSPDGKLLAGAGTRGDIYLWELATGKYLHSLIVERKTEKDELEPVSCLAFSPDSKVLAGGTIFNICLWDAGTGNVTKLVARHAGSAAQLRFSKDGKKLTAVYGFYGHGNRDGEDLLVYPTVKEWSLD